MLDQIKKERQIRLVEKLRALYVQYDLETRVDEKIRLGQIIKSVEEDLKNLDDVRTTYEDDISHSRGDFQESYNKLKQKGISTLNEAKLIIVGEPEAGKSTLLEKLFNPNYPVPQNEDPTIGIQIREGWSFEHPYKPDMQFTANIWDFGGQQIQYMTHQFFLTPSAVYILVAANDRKEATNKFSYWFKIIHLLGETKNIYSPVIVVLNNKNDQFTLHFDLSYYQSLYPNLNITIAEVDLSKIDDKYYYLVSTIKNKLVSLQHVNDLRPKHWDEIRKELKIKNNKNHITYSEYKEICELYGILDDKNQEALSTYLHRLGSILHFIEDIKLSDFIILNPQWAVDAVYSVLNDNTIAKNSGYFTLEKLKHIWSKKYSLAEQGKLLSLMEKDNFGICYEVNSKSKTYLAPQLLNDIRPYCEWSNKNNLQYTYQYKFMPEGIIPRLIVILNEWIENIDNKPLVWLKGLILRINDTRILIQQEENSEGLKVINISVAGGNLSKKYSLFLIRSEIEKLHITWFQNIQVTRLIPCICEYCQNSQLPNYFSVDVLQRAYERGRRTVECSKEFLDVPVLALLEGVFEEIEINNMQGGERFMTQVSHHYHGSTTVHHGDNHQSGNTVTAGENSMVAIGHNITQKLNSDNITTTITTDQRKIIGQIIEEALKNKGTMSDDDLEVIIDARKVLRADEKQSTPETQGKLARFWSALQANTDFANNVLGVAGALGASTAITGYLPFIIESVKSVF